jgi:hypothetical protein
MNGRFMTLILGSISVVGAIGIPMGDPRFFTNALILESSFVILTVLSIFRLKWILIPSIIVSVMVIIANTVSPKHMEIMTNMFPIGNAFVLIIGGYLLQIILLIFSIKFFKNRKILG